MLTTKIASFNLSRLVSTGKHWFVKRAKSRKYTALSAVKLRKLGDEVSELRNWGSICGVILGKPAKEVFDLLQTHQTCEQPAEIGFDEQFLRGPAEQSKKEG